MLPRDAGNAFSKSAAENYEQYFVPSIGEPIGRDLIEMAALRPNERVLDVACGTGIVARLASQHISAGGTLAALDINPGMLAVARSTLPSDISIDWHEASADSIPFPDASFDVVLCQMGLEFMPDKNAALCEMQRVLVPGGRLIFNVPGPTPRMFKIMEDAFARHVGTDAARFINLVFSLHETEELKGLIQSANFQHSSVQSKIKSLHLPLPEDFLWQYIYSTPLANVMAHMDDKHRTSLQHDIVGKWNEFVESNELVLRVRIVSVIARK